MIQVDQVEWDCKKLDQHHNAEPYIEIRLKQDVPFFQPFNTTQKPLVADVKDAERYTAGDRPVNLYQDRHIWLVSLGGRLMCTNKCAQPEGHFSVLGGLLSNHPNQNQKTTNYQMRKCTAKKFLQLFRAL